jgi:hypothetical protein
VRRNSLAPHIPGVSPPAPAGPFGALAKLFHYMVIQQKLSGLRRVCAGATVERIEII